MTLRSDWTYLLADIDHLAPRLALVKFRIERLVALLVVLDPLPEVLLGLQRILTVIVRVARSDLDSDVGGNHGRVGADGFDKEELETRFALDARFERFPPRASRIGGVYSESQVSIRTSCRRQ